jgi:pilus assembly protein CpaE
MFTTVAARGAQRRPVVLDAENHAAVIVVRSPKGGSGKTMVASNVAVLLAEQHPGEVVLVDLDLQFGDVSSALGVEPHYTIADATANADLTPTSLKASLSRHTSGLYALCAPPRPEDAAVVTGDDVTAVLALLRAAFRYVVVDTAAGTSEHTIAALESATDVMLVCSMDVSSVRALAKDRSDHRATTGPAQHVVLNRGDSRVALEVRDIEATLGRKVDVQLSSSRLVPLHMNCGAPVVIAEPAAPISRQLGELVERVVPVAVESAARSKRWRRR